MTVTRVETDIIVSIATSLIGRAEILVIMYENRDLQFKTDVSDFIITVLMCLTSHGLIIFSI